MPNTSLDLLAIGDSSIDLLMKIDLGQVQLTEGESPKMCFLHGSKIYVDEFYITPAGNSCHVVAGCQKLGLQTAIYTELGGDQYADQFIQEFKSRGIITDYCIKNQGTLTNVHPIVSAGNDRTIFIYHEKRNYKIYNWPTPKWLHYSSLSAGFENYQKDIIKYLNNNPKIGVIYNPGGTQLRNLDSVKEFLTVTDIILVNDEEAKLIAGNHSLRELHTKIHQMGAKLTFITLGEKGSTAYDGKDYIEMDAYDSKKPTLDKTGAGDAYSSGVISALFHNKSLADAMKWGTLNAGNKMQKIGGIHGLLSKEEMEKLSTSTQINFKVFE